MLLLYSVQRQAVICSVINTAVRLKVYFKVERIGGMPVVRFGYFVLFFQLHRNTEMSGCKHAAQQPACTGLTPGECRCFSADRSLSDPPWCSYSGSKVSWILLVCSESADRELMLGCGFGAGNQTQMRNLLLFWSQYKTYLRFSALQSSNIYVHREIYIIITAGEDLGTVWKQPMFVFGGEFWSC